MLAVCLLPLLLAGCAGGQGNAAIHRSYFLDRAFFDRAYERVVVRPTPRNVLGGIVPHHLLASHELASFYTSIARTTQPSVVVVIGPNHLNKGEYPVVFSNARWRTPYGILQPATDIVDRLVESGGGVIDERLFDEEHSISAEVAFLRRAFPRAPVLPIAVKTSVPAARVDTLVAGLENALPKDALVLASVDFAHDVFAAQARTLDAQSIPVLERLDVAHLADVTADSPVTLMVLLRFLRARGVTRGTVFLNTNAAEVTGDETIPDVTSYLFLTYAKP